MNTFEPTAGAKIVVIGGGTGSFVVLSGLKNYTHDITALVNMVDDGGSTGVLRDELGVLPPGDVRQCLVALSRSPEVRELFNYRFADGSLRGHAFGNLFLTALEKMTGSFAEGVELASQVLQIVGRVEPITFENVRLFLRDSNGMHMGQHEISQLKFDGKKRPKIQLGPDAKPNPRALSAINSADVIVIAPGSLYDSLAPTLLVSGVGKALATAKAKKVYICNLITKPGQTDGFSVQDFASEIERLAGYKFLDYVVYNTNKPSKRTLGSYAKDGEFAVDLPDLTDKRHYKMIGRDLLSEKISKVPKGDLIGSSRTLIRHDPDKLARQIMKIFFS
ncbi:YvcK family protein [Candidatus Saccharibacteria bacterium]|nr:YvcK family protein [Candidatus Saccharibacteria bacterium]